MPLKKTVAMERRVDLASLFCLIARHGPAVLMALVVIGCGLAGFLWWRNMRETRRNRGRRRRRRTTADSRGDDSHAGHGDAALGLGEDGEPCAEEEEEVSRRGSTDASDEEHGYHSHIRYRRAAPERNPYKDKRPDGDTAVNEASYSFFWNRYSPKATESRVEETRYNSERNFSHATTEDVTEEVCGANDPGLMTNVGNEEKGRATEADSSEDITSTTEDVSEEEFAQEEETVQFAFTSQLCSAPAPTLSPNDARDNAEEPIANHQELENCITPVLKQEISSAPCIEHQEVALDQVPEVLEQNLSLQCGEPASVPHLNHEQQTDITCTDIAVQTSLSVEGTEEDLVKACNNETCESETLKLVDTKDDCSLASTADANVAAADLSSNSQQQSEPPASPTLDTEVNENGLCPQEQTHFETDLENNSNQKDIGLVKTECPKATCDDGKMSNLESTSHSVDVSVAAGKGLDPPETTERAETESSILSEDTSAVQNQQCQEMLPQVSDGNHPYTDNFSDQKDNIQEEQQTLLVRPENINILDHKEGQSSHVDFKHEECSAHPSAPQSQPCEVMEEKTSLSGLAADVKEEISVTHTAVQTNDQEWLEGTSDLDTETILPSALPSQTSENESNQTCQEEESMDTTNISASTRSKIECMVERMVAEVYKDVTQTAPEAQPMQLEENKSLKLPQDNDGTPDNLPCKEVDGEVAISSSVAARLTEEIVNSVSCLNNITKVEDEVQKVIDVATDVSENRCQIVTFNDDGNIPVTEAMPNSQDTNHLEGERQEHLLMDRNVENEISVPEDVHLIQQMAIEVKSTEVEQNVSLEQPDEPLVQPILDVNGTVHKDLSNEPIVNVVQQEMCAEAVCSNVGTQTQAETTTVSCVEESNTDKVEDEKVIQSGAETQIVDIVKTSYQFEQQSEQKQSEVISDFNETLSNKTKFEGGKLKEKEEGQQEIPSGIEAKVLEITATQSEVHSDLKESGMLLDTDNGPSNETEFQVENVLLENEGGKKAIPLGIETKDVKNTTTLNEVQSEQKESELLSDTGSNILNTTVKSSKVVIVCRTLEASVSTVEMSDSEDFIVDDETYYLEPTSLKSSCQDTDINRNLANEETCANIEAWNGTLAAQIVIEEMTTEEKNPTETGEPFDLTSHVTQDIAQDNSASMASTEQIGQKDNVASTPSLESGISSMMVSPEEEDTSKVIGQDALTICQVYTEEMVSHSVLSNNEFVTTTKEEFVTMEIEPQTPSSLENSSLEEMSNDISMTNEDSFGSEIEDGYHKATEEFMSQFVDSIKDTSEDMTKETVQKLEKKEQACVADKQNGEKVDSEKTDISIMEATMDHNEWITDSNYQVLPWMTTASFSSESNSSKEAKDVVESKAQDQASCSEESVENAKKVLAVQPMPQNVNVTFRIHYVTLSPFQAVAVTGDQPELGAWKSVVPLEKTKDGYWTCVASLPAETNVEWKFVILERGEVCRWEECGNRMLYTGYGDDLLVHKWWGFL